MPLLRLIAEGVGPFETLDLDLSDGKGKPHLGPHILAGVNGSGKSTILRTLAWVMDWGKLGFQYDHWLQVLKGHAHSRASVLIQLEGLSPYVWASSKGLGEGAKEELIRWVRSAVVEAGVDRQAFAAGLEDAEHGAFHDLQSENQDTGPGLLWARFPGSSYASGLFNLAAYSPSKALHHLLSPDLTKRLTNAYENCLGFEATVNNDAIQSWLLSLYSKRAIARERAQSVEDYTRSLGRFEKALELIYAQEVAFDVEIEPTFQPRLRLMGHSLNFSQLPDGVRSTVAWVSDFMMREDLMQWDPRLKGRRPGILLLDEVDAHLHPFWQRRLLPAMREALPDVQIIVTSHSPFVISSCPNSRVHVLELDARGRAHPRSPVDSPIGESVTTTLKEIFGVDSRFDVRTEKELNEWNELKRRQAAGSLSRKEKSRLKDLTVTLSERSEELKSIVASPGSLSRRTVESLLDIKVQESPPKRHDGRAGAR